MLMSHFQNPLLSQQVASWRQQRPTGEQQTVAARIMINAPAIDTTVAPVTRAFYREVQGEGGAGCGWGCASF